MKKIYLLSILIFGLFNGHSQNQISLTFHAKDSITQNPLALDSVNIKNLTVNCDTTLYDSVSILTMNALWPVGIKETTFRGSGSFILMQNVPNPFQGTTMVPIYLKQKKELNLAVYDIQGKKLSEYSNGFEKGWHSFAITTNGSRLLFLIVSDNTTIKTIKILSTGSGFEEDRISYVGETGQGSSNLKSTMDATGFIFYLGNQLLYTAYVNGYHASYLFDSPVSSETYTFAMLPAATPTEPTVLTSPVTDITQTTATSGGNVISDGGATVTTKGVCWSTSSNPTTADNHTSDGSGTGSYISYLTGLTPNTPYYIRAYAINSVGTAYGAELTFTTLSVILPVVTTTPMYNIAQTTATSGGNVTSDGGATVTARGVCWSTSSNPTTAGSHTTDGSGTGTFVSNLTGLTPNTPYYIRAYATNSIGTAYGNQLTFTTLAISIPVVTTDSVTNITQTTATSGGNVTSDGGATVTARGVCWSISSGPTTSGSHTTDGSGTGTFVSNLIGLTLNTLYYIRAYATNSIGTAYGDELTFTTLGTFACGDSVNYIGQYYHTVLIGSQCWFKESLNVGTMISGTQDQTNNSVIEKYCYNNLTSNCDIYGGLYQWGEMVQYLNGASNTTSWNPVPTGNVQGICPTGWHLPYTSEWTTLINYLGGTNVAGGKMKEAGTTHWNPPNTGATNSSGFTGLPAGVLNVVFSLLNLTNMLGVTDESSPTLQNYVGLLNTTAAAFITNSPKSNGQSVRCVKD